MKYGYGHAHQVSKATWYRHLEQAATQDEKARILAANFPVLALPEQPESSAGPSRSGVQPPSQSVADGGASSKRTIEAESYYLGRRKRAKNSDSQVSFS
jgi:hypothetical protein